MEQPYNLHPRIIIFGNLKEILKYFEIILRNFQNLLRNYQGAILKKFLTNFVKILKKMLEIKKCKVLQRNIEEI